MSKAPNVVWIMTDQHARHATGCYGSTVAQTPSIDALAGTALRFDCAFTPSPVCVPARDATLSGRYPQNLGFWQQGGHFPKGMFRTGAHAFREHGYVTAFVGKMHPVIPYTRGFDYYVDLGHYYDYLGPKLKHFVLDHMAQDSGSGCPWMHEQWYTQHRWTEENGPTQVREGIKAYKRVLDAPNLLPDEDQFEAFVGRNAEAFLDRHGADPFFLCVNFIKPHFPYASPRRHHDKYRPEHMRLAGNACAWPDTPECNRRWAEPNLADPAVRCKAQQLMADYYAAVSHADECVGMVLDQLRERGLWDNTVVVYTTDHGEMLFHHGLVQKFVFYDEAARIPLIIRAPGVSEPGSATPALTDLTDLLPTCLSLCGIEPAPELDGVDLSPVIRGETAQVRAACYSIIGPRTMVRTERWKLCHYPKDEWFLFDCENDIAEATNLYEQLKDRPDIATLRDDLLRFGAGRGWNGRPPE